MSERAVSNALKPTKGTANPSDSVDSILTWTGFPACNAFEKLGHLSDSTPFQNIIIRILPTY